MSSGTAFEESFRSSMTPERVLRLGLTGVLLFATGGQLQAAGFEATFHLVPAASWNKGRPKGESFLPGGSIHLYRQGDSDPSLVAKANVPVHIPSGVWLWIAEAPGYVSTESGTLSIPAATSSTTRKNIAWPVSPACEVELTDDRRWAASQRLDVVSLSFGAVYPINPAKRRRAWIPAGRYLSYGVGRGGLTGVHRAATCSQNERKKVGPPALPAADRQDFIATIVLSEHSEAAGEDLEVALQHASGARQSSVAPHAVAWQGRRVSYFYLGVPADAVVELISRHPVLRTAHASLAALGGSAREFPEQKLRPRRAIPLRIDYRPRKLHRSAEIITYYCGKRREEEPYRAGASCLREIEKQPLETGLHEYSISNLDDGQYLVHARIDEEVVYGLGHSVVPYLSPEDDEAPKLREARLWELAMYGNLLVKGKPVPGVVRMWPIESDLAPVREFPTDDELEYHLTYFGHLPWSKNAPSKLGLYILFTLEACGSRGFCRLFHNKSKLIGEGRMDIDLSGAAALEVRVVSAADGTPLRDAWVGIPASQAFTFEDGEVTWFTPKSLEPEVAHTDATGIARINLPRSGEQRFAVVKPGYEKHLGRASVAPNQKASLEVRLEPEAGDRAIQIRFPDGSPAGAAFLLALNADGSRDYACSERTGADGTLDLADQCLRGKSFVVFQRDARIQALDGSRLMGTVVEVDRAPKNPVRLRVLDAEGQPVAGVPVELRYGRWALGPNDLLAAFTRTGVLLFYLTDSKGEIYLNGVDPGAPDAPTVAPLIDRKVDAVHLGNARPGETIEVRLGS
jgi:hypothetical protein